MQPRTPMSWSQSVLSQLLSLCRHSVVEYRCNLEPQSMCGRYRSTKRRMLEIEQYYDIDELAALEIWKREYKSSQFTSETESLTSLRDGTSATLVFLLANALGHSK